MLFNGSWRSPELFVYSLLHLIEVAAEGRVEGFVPIRSKIVGNTRGLTLKSTKRQSKFFNVEVSSR